MKDYDAILGLDWLEEHYALVDCRRKKIVFRIPGEDEFSHPLPRNLAGKFVISTMKAMHMVNKGCDTFLASVGRVEELLVAEELWNDHKKPFFFPFSSAATCTNHPLQVDQRVVWRSSWWLRSCGTTTRSRSSSPSRLLRPAQTTLFKSTKGHSVCPRAPI
ncbi:hypothetical protein Taro_006359 [Colocasia esculenta]|uniref:Reverse transcriptase domain-containing protein n=1 Tax=Colocasia esculenta TaxID=4460 RepID=A0A843TWT0_COLES|nr:hypothetical protein [Colocasia esculenta]